MPCSVVSSMFEAVLTFLLANNADRPHPPQVVNPFPRYASGLLLSDCPSAIGGVLHEKMLRAGLVAIGHQAVR